MRTAFAEEAGTTLIAMGGAPGEAYVPSGYEIWSQLRRPTTPATTRRSPTAAAS